MGLLEKLPYQQALVIALDDFGWQVAQQAERYVQDFDTSLHSELKLETGLDQAKIGVTIGWIRAAYGEDGKCLGSPLGREGKIRSLAETVAATFNGLAPLWWNYVEVPEGRVTGYPVFLVRCLETPADARALLEVGQTCREYVAAHPEIEASHVYGFCYAPTHRESGDRALAVGRSEALYLLAEAMAEPASPCDHVMLFEDVTPTASAAATPEDMKVRLANLLFLLLTSRPLAEHYDQMAQQYDARERHQFFSTLGTCSLVYPAAEMAERAGLQMIHDYLGQWVFPERENAEAYAEVDDALKRVQGMLDTRQWQQEIIDHCAESFPARLAGAGAEQCLEFDARALFGGARLEQIRERISPPSNPAAWATSLDETDAVISLWIPRYDVAVARAFDGRESHPEEGWESHVEKMLRAEVERLLKRDAGPPIAFSGVRRFLEKTKTQAQIQRQSLNRHFHGQVDLASRYKALAKATSGLPPRPALDARFLIGAVLAAVFLWLAFGVASLPPCPAAPLPIFFGASADLCMPYQETARNSLYVLSAVSLVVTWGGLWLWHRRLLIIAREAWEDYWLAIERKYSYIIHGKMVERSVLLLNRLEQETIPALEESLDALEESLRRVAADHPLLPVERMIDPSRFGLNLLDSGVYEQLFHSHIFSSVVVSRRDGKVEVDGFRLESPSQAVPENNAYHAILRSLASGRELFPQGLATEAHGVTWQALWDKSYGYAAARLLSLTAGQILGDYSGPILQRFLSGSLAGQRSHRGLIRFMARRATPLSSVRDAREDPGRLGRPHTFLLFSGTNRLTSLHEQGPDFEVREVADPHRISVVSIVEPFSLRALASVLGNEKSRSEQEERYQ